MMDPGRRSPRRAVGRYAVLSGPHADDGADDTVRDTTDASQRLSCQTACSPAAIVAATEGPGVGLNERYSFFRIWALILGFS